MKKIYNVAYKIPMDIKEPVNLHWKNVEDPKISYGYVNIISGNDFGIRIDYFEKQFYNNILKYK